MAQIQLTMLNGMGGGDFAASLDQHARWGLGTLDLKDSLFGKGIADLDDADLGRAKELIDAHGMTVATLSTTLFHAPVEEGHEYFQKNYLDRIPRVIEIARTLKPRCIRLLAAQTRRRGELADCFDYLRKDQPWVFELYGSAVDQVHAGGFKVLIENEVGTCILSKPAEVTSFLTALAKGRREKLGFMWDIQNFWQMGTFPSLAVYRQLKPWIAQVHVKGGQSETPGGPLKWASSLADASWPVLEILQAVAADGVSPVICLNPSHGGAKPGYDYSNVTWRDIEFLRKNISEIG